VLCTCAPASPVERKSVDCRAKHAGQHSPFFNLFSVTDAIGDGRCMEPPHINTLTSMLSIDRSKTMGIILEEQSITGGLTSDDYRSLFLSLTWR